MAKLIRSFELDLKHLDDNLELEIKKNIVVVTTEDGGKIYSGV